MSGQEIVQSREKFFGSLVDLQRISELQIPELETAKDLQDFLEFNLIPEGLGNAIKNEKCVIVMGQLRGRGSPYFNALISEGFRLGIRKDDDGNLDAYYEDEAVLVSGVRSTPGGLFNYDYKLALPIDPYANYSLGSRKPVQASYRRTDKEASSYYDSSDKRNPGDPKVVAQVVKEVAADLHVALELRQEAERLRKEIADNIGRIVVEQRPRY